MGEAYRRIGLFGGSFDPVHLGHLILATDIRESLNLDAIWFIPAAQTPLKSHSLHASASLRLAMLEAAIEGIEGLAVDPIEIEHGGTSYTVDTVLALQEDNPKTRFTFILGTDQFQKFPLWREPDTLAKHVDLAVLIRDADSLAIPKGLPPELNWNPFNSRRIDISSTEIRNRLQSGDPVNHFLPSGVSKIIYEHNLYQNLEHDNRAESLTDAYGSNT